MSRSIKDHSPLETNVLGTVNLLAFKSSCEGNFVGKRFCHTNTDEAYGTLGDEVFLRKTFRPKIPLFSFKASSDHFVRAYVRPTTYLTFSIALIIMVSIIFLRTHTRFYQQHLKENPTVYGDGNYKDWLYVKIMQEHRLNFPQRKKQRNP